MLKIKTASEGRTKHIWDINTNKTLGSIRSENKVYTAYKFSTTTGTIIHVKRFSSYEDALGYLVELHLGYKEVK